MLSLKQRLLSTEDDFLTALISGEDAVSRFNTRWDALIEDLNAALESGLLDPDLSTLAHSTAIRVATLADTSIEVLTSCDSVTSDLMCQLDGLMSELALEESSPNDHYTPPAALLENLCTPLSVNVAGHASRKRRRSVSPDDWVTDTPQKRSCRSRSTLPAPASYSRRCVETPGPPAIVLGTSEAAAAELPISPPRTSRKRRLSDAEPSPMKSKRLHVGPRLHAVSDSFLHTRNTKLRPPTMAVRDRSLPVPSNRPDIRSAQTPPSVTIAPLLGSYTATSTSQTPLPELDGFDDLLKSLMDDSIPTIPLPTNQLSAASQLGGDEIGEVQPLASNDEQPSASSSLSTAPIPVPSATISSLTPSSNQRVDPVWDEDFSPYTSDALSPDDPWQSFVPLFESFDYGSSYPSPQSTQSSLSSPAMPKTPPLPPPLDHHDSAFPAVQDCATLHPSKSSHSTIYVRNSPSPSEFLDISAMFKSSFNVDPVIQSLDDSWSAWFEAFDAHSTPIQSSSSSYSYDPLESPWELHTVGVVELKGPDLAVDSPLRVVDCFSPSH